MSGFMPVNPRPMLLDLVGKEIRVRLKWGYTEYTGALVSADSYMNLQLANTEEFINGESQGTLGQVLIRCNNVLWISAKDAGEPVKVRVPKRGKKGFAWSNDIPTQFKKDGDNNDDRTTLEHPATPLPESLSSIKRTYGLPSPLDTPPKPAVASPPSATSLKRSSGHDGESVTAPAPANKPVKPQE